MVAWLLCGAAVCALGWSARAQGDAASRILRFELTPAARVQLAIWIEDAEGQFLQTVRLTEAVALRGVGNRPGATQMNSGFRWPYGRREAILPIWATRRASAPDTELFPRVIFQNRTSEGHASRSTNDHSPDDYFCLSFNRERSGREALDAMSCASVFSSDKGRYLTEADVAEGYAEPTEDPDTGAGSMQPLPLGSLYPARRDVSPCTSSPCYDHADVARFDADAREIMPDIDAVTMATPPGDTRQRILFSVPSDWPDGEYVAWIEAHVEGDYNAGFDDTTHPTPTEPSSQWDRWAVSYGYPYRGQPSVVYRIPFELGGGLGEQTYSTSAPEGRGSWDPYAPEFGMLQGLDGITDDPEEAPGSGADRLRMQPDGSRATVVVEQGMCDADQPPGPVSELRVSTHRDELHAHEWGRLSFMPASDPEDLVFAYDVRISRDPVTDEESFMRAPTAKAADVEGQGLVVPSDAATSERIEVAFGGMNERTDYHVAVRALDACNQPGPIRTVQHTTPERTFATVDPCFVATAAYGTPFAAEIEVLRRFRDTYLMTHAPGRALVATYYQVGPHLAELIRERDVLRAAVRWLLTPVVELARWSLGDPSRGSP